MIGVQLNYEIVISVAIVVVKECEIALFALRPARPVSPVILSLVFSRRNHYAMFLAPPDSFARRIFIRKPCVMRVGLLQHRYQSFSDNLERLGGRFRYNHGYPIPRANRDWRWRAGAR